MQRQHGVQPFSGHQRLLQRQRIGLNHRLQRNVLLARHGIQRGTQAVGCTRQYEGQAVHGRKCDLRRSAGLVAGCADQVAVHHRQCLFQLWQRRAIPVQDGNVHARVGKPLFHLATGPFEYLEADRGVALAQIGKQPTHQRQGNRWQQTQRNASGRLSGFAANLILQLVGTCQQQLDLGEQRSPDFRQLDTAPGPVEQARATFALQRIELAAQQRLVAVQEQRGTGQATQFSNSHEGPPLEQVGNDVELEVGGFGLHG